MATDHELITRTVRDHLERWYGADVVRSAPNRDYLHLIGTGGGWKIVHALWLPQ